MKANIVRLAAASLLAACCVAKADMVQLSLPCAGVYDLNTPYWSADFDLGVSFTDISHVYVDWSGEITGGFAVEYEPGDPFPIDVGAYASLGPNPYIRRTTFWGGAVTYPDAQPFDELLEFELLGGSTWSDLLDGQAAIVIGYTELIIPGSYVEHGSIVLDSATLVVDGTVVPEPATLLLLALGGLLIRKRRCAFVAAVCC